MTIKFDFNLLRNIYLQALKSHDKTLIFDSNIGKGKFLFMMFLSEEDAESKDWLFVYLRNTSYILQIKMYGNHEKGKFEVYIDDEKQGKFIEELRLSSSGEPFDFNNFLKQLNNSIPQIMPIDEKVKMLRNNRDKIKRLKVIDEADRTVLIGERRLPDGRNPQDKTLRKLT